MTKDLYFNLTKAEITKLQDEINDSAHSDDHEWLGEKAALMAEYEEESAKSNLNKKVSSKSAGRKRGRKSKKAINLFPIGWGFQKKEQEKKKEPKKKFTKQSYTMTPQNRGKKVSFFWVIVGVTSFISLLIILSMFVATRL